MLIWKVLRYSRLAVAGSAFCGTSSKLSFKQAVVHRCSDGVMVKSLHSLALSPQLPARLAREVTPDRL